MLFAEVNEVSLLAVAKAKFFDATGLKMKGSMNKSRSVESESHDYVYIPVSDFSRHNKRVQV
jgi:hypothetical protein